LLTRAFVEPLAEAVTAGTQAMLNSAEDPFAAMVAVARSRERADFGAEFVFAHPADDAELTQRRPPIELRGRRPRGWRPDHSGVGGYAPGRDRLGE
jgi:hypothetical protein